MINSIDARNSNGQTIATHKYVGTTEEEFRKETNDFINKWSEAHSYKPFGDEVCAKENPRVVTEAVKTIKVIEQQGQAQYSLSEQLCELCVCANKLGLYDARDYLQGIIERS